MFCLGPKSFAVDMAESTWASIAPKLDGLLIPGEVTTLDDIAPPRVIPEPDGLLAATIVPQHVDAGAFTVVWTIHGRHTFYYGTQAFTWGTGVLMAFYDGRLHSLIPSEYNVSLVWACFYLDFASPISARKFFETFVDNIV